MGRINVFIATLVLTGFAVFPASVFAGGLDDLAVTMEVMDDIAGIDDAISRMRGPESDDIDHDVDHDVNDDVEDEHGFDDASANDLDDAVSENDEFENPEDDFENDEDFDEDDLDEDDDFEDEEGEDVDDDDFDEEDEEEEDDDDDHS